MKPKQTCKANERSKKKKIIIDIAMNNNEQFFFSPFSLDISNILCTDREIERVREKKKQREMEADAARYSQTAKQTVK